MIRNLQSNLDRFFSNGEFEKRFYMWAFLITTIAFVFYGIAPLFSSLSKKRQAIVEITHINKNLGNKITAIREQESNLQEIKGSLEYLDRYLPETFGVQDYLVDFALSCAESGYIMQNFYPTDTQDENSISASVLFRGSGDLAQLVGDIEVMKRITQVNFVTATFSEEDTINMNIKIYTIK